MEQNGGFDGQMNEEYEDDDEVDFNLGNDSSMDPRDRIKEGSAVGVPPPPPPPPPPATRGPNSKEDG